MLLSDSHSETRIALDDNCAPLSVRMSKKNLAEST